MKISTFFVNAILFFTSQLLKLNYSVTEKAISLPLTEKLLSLYYIETLLLALKCQLPLLLFPIIRTSLSTHTYFQTTYTVGLSAVVIYKRKKKRS